MKRIHWTALAVASIALAGCVTTRGSAPSSIVPATAWADRITVTLDDYTKIRTHLGAAVRSDQGTVNLRAFEHTTQPVPIRLQVYVVAGYAGDWRFYDRAHDINGNTLAARSLARNVLSCRAICAKEEHMAIDVTRDQLMRVLDTGLDLQVSGRGGKQQFFLPPAYIEAFLASLPRAGL